MTLAFMENQMVVFDGDSLTNRRSAGTPDTWPFLRLMNWDKPWPDMLAEMLFCWRPDLNLRFFNAASGGSTCKGMAERFDERVLARKPDWVIASVGPNDARAGIAPDEYRQVMAAYASRVRQECGGQVFFFGQSETGPDFPEEKLAIRKGAGALYGILGEIAADMAGVHYIDIGPALASKARILKSQCELHSLYGDAGHYNAIGNMIVAGEILAAFGMLNLPASEACGD